MAQIISPKDTFALPGMSSGVVASGPFIFISGQVALNSEGVIVGEDDFPEQVKQVMKNFEAVLREGGATFRDVVKIGVFLSDRQYLPIWRELRGNYFSEPFPASTLVIAQLISPSLLIEVEAIASVGG
jgi:enamine deaminase RidA (YjgF/YER057c/UK114 family)